MMRAIIAREAGWLILTAAALLYPSFGDLKAEQAIQSDTAVIKLETNSSLVQPSPAKGTNQSSAFDLFKAFVANPPPIEEIKFSFIGPPRYLRDASGRTAQVPAPKEYYWARWQPHYLIIVKVPQLKNLELNPMNQALDSTIYSAAIQASNECWSFNYPLRSVTYWQGVPNSPSNFANPVLLSYRSHSLPLWSLLNMGPHFIPPGKIRWSGNRFEQKAYYQNYTFNVTGELMPDAHGRAAKMKMHYTGHFVDGHYEINYYYSTNNDLPDFMPSRINSVVFRDNRKSHNKDIYIFSCRIAGQTLAPELFRADNWSNATNLSRFSYTNETLYAVFPNGDLRPVWHERVPLLPPPLVLAHVNRYYYLACVMFTIAFLIVNKRMRDVINTNQKERSKICGNC